MKNSRFGDVGYWFETNSVNHESNQALCAAKGGTKAMFRLEGSQPHLAQWISANNCELVYMYVCLIIDHHLFNRVS